MMANVVPIYTHAEKQLRRSHLAQPQTLPSWKRDYVDRRLPAVLDALNAENTGMTRSEAVALAAREHDKSAATIRRWIKAFETEGEKALAPAHQGRHRKTQPWDARALELAQLPSRMNSGEIAANLRADGFGNVTTAQVRRFRKTLPSNYDKTSPRKLGRHHYTLNETPYVIREWGHVPVGYLYEMDGHTCDFYVQHPVTGGYFRPELTILYDVRSEYIVDFWLGGFENSMDLRWLLSRAFAAHDHVCHELHIDPGAGTAKTLCDAVVGFGAKLDFAVHFALPGNARSKGLVEGGFGIFEGRFGKMMPTYLHNRTDEAMRLFAAKWKKGLIEKISVKQCYDLINERYIKQRNNEPRKGLKGKTPAELWAALKKNPVIAPVAALVRPRAQRVVRNGRVRIHNRTYELPPPWCAQYEDFDVIVEYDEWQDAQVWIYDLKGRYVHDAPLIRRKPGIPESRVQERLAETERGQRKRLELRLAENAARAKLPINGTQLLASFDEAAETSRDDAAETVIASGISFTSTSSVPVKPREPSAAARHLAEELNHEHEEDAPEDAVARFARACDLEVQEALGEADAQWLAVYQQSPEYHAHRMMRDEDAAEASPLDPPVQPVAAREEAFFCPSSQPSPARGEDWDEGFCDLTEK